MNMVRFDCETCARRIKVEARFVGRRGKCPFCRAPVIVPSVCSDSANVASALATPPPPGNSFRPLSHGILARGSATRRPIFMSAVAVVVLVPLLAWWMANKDDLFSAHRENSIVVPRADTPEAAPQRRARSVDLAVSSGGRPDFSGEYSDTVQEPPDASPPRYVNDGTPFLDELSEDPVYGSAHRWIIREVGNQIPKKELAIKLGTVNGLAQKARMTGDQLLEHFRFLLAAAHQRGLGAPEALNALSGSIAFRLARSQEHGAQ